MAEKETDYADVSLESWTQISSTEVPAAVSTGILLLGIATFLMQLGLVLAFIFWCWRQDRKRRPGEPTDGKVAAAGLSFHQIEPWEKCSDPATKAVYILLPEMGRTAGTDDQWDFERGHFPPWDLVQSP